MREREREREGGICERIERRYKERRQNKWMSENGCRLHLEYLKSGQLISTCKHFLFFPLEDFLFCVWYPDSQAKRCIFCFLSPGISADDCTFFFVFVYLSIYKCQLDFAMNKWCLPSRDDYGSPSFLIL